MIVEDCPHCVDCPDCSQTYMNNWCTLHFRRFCFCWTGLFHNRYFSGPTAKSRLVVVSVQLQLLNTDTFSEQKSHRQTSHGHALTGTRAFCSLQAHTCCFKISFCSRICFRSRSTLRSCSSTCLSLSVRTASDFFLSTARSSDTAAVICNKQSGQLFVFVRNH